MLAALDEGRATTLDALALCVHAHIHADLPAALADSQDFALHVADFERCQKLLAGSIDQAQDELWQRFGALYRHLDFLGGRSDEAAVAAWLRRLRTDAWYDAFRLAGAGADRSGIERALAVDVEDFVSDLLDPAPFPVAVAAGLVRRAARFLRRRSARIVHATSIAPII